tara:strand:+ start:5361 stop:6620 length:1260 start_codon:yes stop_codon:yes gene_type:complete
MTELEKLNLMLQGGYNPMGGGINTNQMNDFIAAGFRKPFDNKPVMQNLFNTQQFSQNVEDKKQANQRLKNQQLGNFLLAFSDTLRGVNPAQGVLQRQELFQQQADERKAEEERNRILASMSDDVRKIFETYGPVAAFQYKQAQDNAEITALQKQRQAQSFRDAGLDERSISLFTDTDLSVDDILKLTGPSEDQKQIDALLGAGYTPEEANAIAVGGLDPDDIFKNNKIISNENIIKNVNDNVNKYLEDSKVQDTYANITEAFGPFDALQSAATTVTNPLGFVVGGKTNEAVNARTNLNNEIRANLVDDYSGRPNVFLLSRIEELIPTTSFTSEFDAMQRYKLIKNSFDSMVVQLEAGINGNLLSDATKQKYADDLYKTKIVQAKLEAAIKGLEGDEQANVNIVSEGKNTGQYNNFYLEE